MPADTQSFAMDGLQSPEKAHLHHNEDHDVYETRRASRSINAVPLPDFMPPLHSRASYVSSSAITADLDTISIDFEDCSNGFDPSVYALSLDYAISESVYSRDVTDEDNPYEKVVHRNNHFSDAIATMADLQELQSLYPLPSPKGNDESINQLRYGFFSAYRRLFVFVLLANLTAIATVVTLHNRRPDDFFDYRDAATATGANLLLAALMRHEHCVNALFHAACSLPHSTPVSVRRHAAKVYSYGGVHSGCGVSALFWYIVYAVLVIRHFNGTEAEEFVVSISTAITLVVLTMIVFTAHPFLRARWHNQWEMSHRYGGWTAIAMVWAQTIAIAFALAKSTRHSVGHILVATPTFWFLCLITACIVYPWLRMRKVPVVAEPLSSHAVRLHFKHRDLPFCAGNRLTDAPLKETHGFATIPNTDSKDAIKGYSCLVSNGGDWTKRMIDSPPERLWIRGAPTLGVMRIVTLFKPVVVVATGSGIGPCMSFLNVYPDYPMRIIWSARFPEQTYGPEIMRTVLRADPNALIIDTKRTGHPDLIALTWALVQQSRAEAMVIISNPKVTRQVVYGMETRGVPAFGAIFDS